MACTMSQLRWAQLGLQQGDPRVVDVVASSLAVPTSREMVSKATFRGAFYGIMWSLPLRPLLSQGRESAGR
jgi:hypothetical protein